MKSELLPVSAEWTGELRFLAGVHIGHDTDWSPGWNVPESDWRFLPAGTAFDKRSHPSPVAHPKGERSFRRADRFLFRLEVPAFQSTLVIEEQLFAGQEGDGIAIRLS